jgi:capsid protein
MSTFTNRYSLAGNVIAGVESDSERPVAYIVSNSHSPNLQNIADYLQRFNGQTIRLTIEHDVMFDVCTCLPGQPPHEPGCQLWTAEF